VSNVTDGRPFPIVGKVGIAIIAFGLLFDLVEHSMGAPPTSGSGFSIGEHAAHLIVLAGMVAALFGVVSDGLRVSGRPRRPEGRSIDAIR
jgi:hypothetical protein